MVYSVSKTSNQHSPETSDSSSNNVTDVVSAAIMAKILEERERERLLVKHCDTCTCAQNKTITSPTLSHDVSTQTESPPLNFVNKNLKLVPKGMDLSKRQIKKGEKTFELSSSKKIPNNLLNLQKSTDIHDSLKNKDLTQSYVENANIKLNCLVNVDKSNVCDSDSLVEKFRNTNQQIVASHQALFKISPHLTSLQSNPSENIKYRDAISTDINNINELTLKKDLNSIKRLNSNKEIYIDPVTSTNESIMLPKQNFNLSTVENHGNQRDSNNLNNMENKLIKMENTINDPNKSISNTNQFNDSTLEVNTNQEYDINQQKISHEKIRTHQPNNLHQFINKEQELSSTDYSSREFEENQQINSNQKIGPNKQFIRKQQFDYTNEQINSNQPIFKKHQQHNLNKNISGGYQQISYPKQINYSYHSTNLQNQQNLLNHVISDENFISKQDSPSQKIHSTLQKTFISNEAIDNSQGFKLNFKEINANSPEINSQMNSVISQTLNFENINAILQTPNFKNSSTLSQNLSPDSHGFIPNKNSQTRPNLSQNIKNKPYVSNSFGTPYFESSDTIVDEEKISNDSHFEDSNIISSQSNTSYISDSQFSSEKEKYVPNMSSIILVDNFSSTVHPTVKTEKNTSNSSDVKSVNSSNSVTSNNSFQNKRVAEWIQNNMDFESRTSDESTCESLRDTNFEKEVHYENYKEANYGNEVDQRQEDNCKVSFQSEFNYGKRIIDDKEVKYNNQEVNGIDPKTYSEMENHVKNFLFGQSEIDKIIKRNESLGNDSYCVEIDKLN